jgi:hypothetical protein
MNESLADTLQGKREREREWGPSWLRPECTECIAHIKYELANENDTIRGKGTELLGLCLLYSQRLSWSAA